MALTLKPLLIAGVIIGTLCRINISNAQEHAYKNYSTHDGLPSQVVYSVVQDAEGYMWFGTDAGASRFDGNQFENFTIRDGLSDNEILSIHKDSKGRLWFFTLNGKLCYFYKSTFHNAANDQWLSSLQTKFEFVSFLEDSDSNLWFGTFGSQVLLLKKDGTSQVFNLDLLYKNPYDGDKKWTFCYEAAKSVMWFITGYHTYRIFEYRDNTIRLLANQKCIVPSSDEFAFQNISAGYAFYKTNDGISSIDKGNSAVVLPSSQIDSSTIANRFFIDRNKNIWLYSKGKSVYCFKKSGNYYVMSSSFATGARVASVYVDNEQNTWFSTLGQGVYKSPANNNLISLFPANTSIADKNISCVRTDKEGNIWFSSSNGYLYKWDGSIETKFFLGEVAVSPEIKNFDFDSNENIYCVTTAGIFFLKKNNNTYSVPKEVFARKDHENYTLKGAKFLKFDRNGKLYLSSFRGVLHLRDDGETPFVEYVDALSIPARRVYCLYFDAGNVLWFENFEKLISFSGNELRYYPQLDQEFLSQVTSIEGISDSIIVVASYGKGVKFIKNGRVINAVSTANGLSSDLCRKIFIRKDTIYVATNKGLNFFTYRDNQISGLQSFTSLDGLSSDDVKDIYADDRKIYAATSSGLCEIDKSIFKGNISITPPPVYIKQMTVNGKALSPGTFKSNYNSDIHFDYVGLTFDQPEKLTYQYNLSGKEDGWVPTKNTTAILSSLQPGKYNFQVRAKKYNSGWSTPVSIPFVITPPFWQQWWFQLLVTATIIFITYYLIKTMAARKYRLKLVSLRQQQLLSEERNRISSDMHDDLGADLSNILLLTRMTTRSLGLPAENKNQMVQIEQFTSRVIKKVDEIIWALNPAMDSMADLFEYMIDYCNQFLEMSKMNGGVTISGSIPDTQVSASFRRNIFLVVKEAMNNTLRHSEATSFNVFIEVRKSSLTIKISDNGKGFELNKNLALGDGLLNMKKRIAELKGHFSIDTALGKGITITIDVPFREDHSIE